MVDQDTAPYAALMLRLTPGVMFIAHALPKVLVVTVPGTVRFFESVGFPGVFACVTIAAGIGAAARWAALATVPILLGDGAHAFSARPALLVARRNAA